jgi:hypothetical protein
MGTAFGGDVAQFSKGDYPNSTNTQDDFAIIGTRLALISGAVAGATVHGWAGSAVDGVTRSVTGTIAEAGANGAVTPTLLLASSLAPGVPTTRAAPVVCTPRCLPWRTRSH